MIVIKGILLFVSIFSSVGLLSRLVALIAHAMVKQSYDAGIFHVVLTSLSWTLTILFWEVLG